MRAAGTAQLSTIPIGILSRCCLCSYLVSIYLSRILKLKLPWTLLFPPVPQCPYKI